MCYNINRSFTMKFKGRYWKRGLGSEEDRGPFEFLIEVSREEPDLYKKAIEEAKLYVMCELESVPTTIQIINPQLLLGDQWVSLDIHPLIK